MNEHALKGKVLKRLESFGGFWFKLWGGPYQKPGLPDIVGICEGRFVAIELKSPELKDPKAHLSPIQWRVSRQIKDNGGIFIVSNDDEDVMNQLKEAL